MKLRTIPIMLALGGLAPSAIAVPSAAPPGPAQDCQLEPDDDFDDYTPTLPGSSMTHSREEIIGFIADHISKGLADEIDVATDPEDGCAEVCERTRYGTGKADATTIALRTSRMPLWLCAIVMIHEYRHWQRAHEAGKTTGNPGEGDPETAGSNPCGWCNHAAMGVEDTATAAELCEQLSAAERKQLCDLAWEWRKQIAKALTKCVYDGCTSCCGFSYVPNVDEIWSPPPCCVH